MSKLRTIIGVLIFCPSLSARHFPQPQPTVTPIAQPVSSVPTVAPTVPLLRASPTPTAVIVPTQPLIGSPSCAVRPGDPWRVWRAIQYPAAIHSLLIEQGELWTSTAYGVFRINPNTGVFTRALSGGTIGYGSSLYQAVQPKTGSSAYTVVDADGSAWWVDPTYTPYRSITLGHIGKSSTTTQTLPVGTVYSIVPDPMHGVWLGTDSGLVYSDGSNLRWVSLGLGACTVPVGPRSLVVDPQGIAWVVTWGGVRALALEEAEWHHVPDPTQADKPSSAVIGGIAPAVGGGLWGTHSRDVFRLGGKVTSKPVELPKQRCFVDRLVADANNVWGSRGDCGVMQFNIASGKWSRHSPGGDNVERVAITTDGTVYATGRDGLYVYVGGAEWRRAIQSDITMPAPDRQNGLWFVLNLRGQLWYYKDDHVTAHGQPFQKGVLQSLTVDSRNQLWASLDDKLQVYNGKTWRTIATPMRYIREVVGGPDGRIWLGGDQGVAVYDPTMDRQP